MSDLDLHDDPELRDALHAALAGGPPSPPVQDLLDAAHRARRGQRVRRTAGGLVVAAAVAAVALAGVRLLEAPGGDDRTGIAARGQEPARGLGILTDDRGRLLAAPGTTIVRKVVDPLGDRPGRRSYGVVTRHDGAETWGLVSWSPAGTMTSVEPARSRFAAFEDWLAAEVSASTGTPAPDPVAFDPTGALDPVGSTRIVQEGSGIDLGPAPDGTMTAAAEIVVSGEHRFVLARLVPGDAPQYVVLAPQGPASTFDELVGRAAEIFHAADGRIR